MSKSVVAALVLVSAAAMAADDDVPWYADLHVYGTNTLRYSQYEASGNNSAGPYPFQGDMYFDEFIHIFVNILFNHVCSGIARLQLSVIA